jgi:tRNA pseudouridine55 synthase
VKDDALRSGVLVVDKGRGVTSFDVVALARRRLGVRRIGHAGTLDPDATGVLPILIGEATKLTPYLVDHDKEYLATIRLGVTTDTHDVSGRVLAEKPVPELSVADLEEVCGSFVGRIKQVPPMYSAIHHEGRRLYELAREGIEVERAPREVVVRSIKVEAIAGARATVRVLCGKGTYVRVLAADIGAALGCGGAVEELVRCRVGSFRLDEAVPWRELTTGRSDLWSRVRPAETALAGWVAVRLDEPGAAAFVNGQPASVVPAAAGGGFVRVHGDSGVLLGVGELMAAGHSVRPVRVLHADRPGTRVLPA